MGSKPAHDNRLDALRAIPYMSIAVERQVKAPPLTLIVLSLCVKDMFQRAAPVRGGIGKLLLQKMGWKEGAGLGKDETGDIQPLNLELKVDRKGRFNSVK